MSWVTLSALWTPGPLGGWCPAGGTLILLCVQPGASPKVPAGAALLKLGFVSLKSGGLEMVSMSWGEENGCLSNPKSSLGLCLHDH